MPETIEITAYTFAELSEGAKARALHAHNSSCGFEPNLEPIETAGRILGFEFDTRPVKLCGGGTRFDPDFSYEVGGYRSTDFFAFSGHLVRVKNCVKAIRAEFGGTTGDTLAGIAARWEAIQKRNFYRLSARVCTNYRRESCEVDHLTRFGEDWQNHKAIDEVQGIVNDFCRWACGVLLADYEYECSEEYFADLCDANEYRFDESGRIL